MTVQQIIKENPAASFVAVYEGSKFHTDYCEYRDDGSESLDAEVKEWELMDRARYQETILANSSEDANNIVDFDFGNALIILI